VSTPRLRRAVAERIDTAGADRSPSTACAAFLVSSGAEQVEQDQMSAFDAEQNKRDPSTGS
jgi:hypothetical protein